MLLLKLANRCRNVANRICTKRFRISRAPITIRIRPKTIRNCKQNCWTIKSFTVASTKLSTSKCLCGILIWRRSGFYFFNFFFVEINFFLMGFFLPKIFWSKVFCRIFFGRKKISSNFIWPSINCYLCLIIIFILFLLIWCSDPAPLQTYSMRAI